LGFFTERVFGERRRELLLSYLDATTEAAYREWEDRLAALERALAALDTRRSRLLWRWRRRATPTACSCKT
jgi:hypothetical protein